MKAAPLIRPRPLRDAARAVDRATFLARVRAYAERARAAYLRAPDYDAPLSRSVP